MHNAFSIAEMRHIGTSAWLTVRVRLPFDFVACPHAGHATSSYLSSPCCNNNSPSISPINARRSCDSLPAISSKLASGCSSPHSHIASNISSAPRTNFAFAYFKSTSLLPLKKSGIHPIVPDQWVRFKMGRVSGCLCPTAQAAGETPGSLRCPAGACRPAGLVVSLAAQTQ